MKAQRRNSKKRDQILNVFANGDLLTANEVCEKLEKIDRATVYRNLSLFVKEGILREVHVRKGIASYELKHPGDTHQHLVCQNCEKVVPIDVKDEDIKKVLPKGVEFSEFELNLRGKCKECKYKSAKC